MEDEIKRCATKRKAALLMQIVSGTTMKTEARRLFALLAREIEEFIRDQEEHA